MFGRLITRLTILGICLAAGCGDAAGSPAPGDDDSASHTLNYASWAYDGEGMSMIEEQLPGLILMRHESDMTALGGSRFDDGFGNLVVRGTFAASAAGGGDSDYALTFVKQGGVQLALDLQQDRVVDVVFDITPEGRFGVIGHLALESEIDCIARRMIGGDDPLTATDACFGPAPNPGGSASGSGIAGPTGSEYGRLAEPDCGASGLSTGFLNRAASEGGSEWHEEGNPPPFERNGYKVVISNHTRPSEVAGVGPDLMETVRAQHLETGDSYVVQRTTEYHSAGTTETVDKVTWENLPNGVIRVTGSRTVNGRQVGGKWVAEIDAETHECLKGDCAEVDSNDENTTPEDDSSDDSNSGTDSNGQPGPACEIEGDCPFTDPRCAGPNNDMEALWDCVARTGSSPMDCLARLNDAVYATTGCMTVLGPSGQPELQCPGSDADEVADCLTSGEALDGCLGHGGGSVNENDDLLDTFSSVGSSDINYLDYTGIGAIFLGFCDEGVEQLCGGGPAY